MRALLSTALFVFALLFVVGCDIPTPPPELPTPTPGSQNPENPLARLALTPVPPTPERQFQPLKAAPGHIYFVRDTGLWRIEPDGTGLTNLSATVPTSPPQPSPDGSMIAFVSGKDLYVIPSGGGSPAKVASGEMVAGQRLGWSPDGSTLGYVTLDVTTPGNEQGWAVPSKGGQPQMLATLAENAPPNGPTYQCSVQWSPDGKWVLVSGENNPFKMMRWPLDNDPSADHSEVAGGEPDWSPDSQSILYTETLSGAILDYYVVEDEATPFRDQLALVGTNLGQYRQGPGPRWSPASVGVGSDILAYRSSTNQGEPQVALRQRWGDQLQPLPAPSNNPSWSPTGDLLVIETGMLKDDAFGKNWVPDGLAIAKLNVAGQHYVKSLVKDGRWPAWGK